MIIGMVALISDETEEKTIFPSIASRGIAYSCMKYMSYYSDMDLDLVNVFYCLLVTGSRRGQSHSNFDVVQFILALLTTMTYRWKRTPGRMESGSTGTIGQSTSLRTLMKGTVDRGRLFIDNHD